MKIYKILFVNLITVAVMYCRYVIDKDIVKTFTNIKIISS